MSHQRRKLVSLVVLLVGAAFAHSQSLGDVARQTRAQRAKSVEPDVLAVGQSAALTQMTQPFSADFSNTDQSGRATGRLYFSAPRMREETVSVAEASNEAGGSAIESLNFTYIIDGGTQTTYVLMPRFQHTYLEFRGNRPGFIAAGLDFLRLISGAMANLCAEHDTNCKKLGSETINGHPCEIWEATDQSSGRSMSLWIDQVLHFPVRIHVSDGSVIEFTNIKEGPQDASLFSVPTDYKPFDPSLFAKHAAADEKTRP
jgi:hypothetical protein